MGRIYGARAAKSVVIQIAGWLLVVLGLAALVLPGPGLLTIFAGMAVLSTQYRWANKRLHRVRDAALRGAAHGVATWPRIGVSVLGILVMIAVGITWGIQPSPPGFWPLPEKWWLIGGWGTGSTIIASALLAGAIIVYSYRNLRHYGRETLSGDDTAQREGTR